VEPAPKKSGLSTAVIVIIAIAGLILVLAIGFGVFKFMNKSKKDEKLIGNDQASMQNV